MGYLMADFDNNRMQVFVNFPEVEDKLRQEINERVQGILLTEAKNGERPSYDVVIDYLCHEKWEARLTSLIGLSGGSLERLKRVARAIFAKQSWPNLQKDEEARKLIAKFLTNPDDFADKIPEFIRRCFYLRDGWVKSLRDEKQVTALVIDSLKSLYSVECGFAQERLIVSEVTALGLNYEKGSVEIVNNKEVDVAIPSIKNPRILIMSSYQLTTASMQSSRANEQALMYDDIARHNRRHPDSKPILLWNVVDGGGWLERKNDLRKMLINADSNFCHADIAEGFFSDALKKCLK